MPKYIKNIKILSNIYFKNNEYFINLWDNYMMIQFLLSWVDKNAFIYSYDALFTVIILSPSSIWLDMYKRAIRDQCIQRNVWNNEKHKTIDYKSVADERVYVKNRMQWTLNNEYCRQQVLKMFAVYLNRIVVAYHLCKRLTETVGVCIDWNEFQNAFI